MTAAGSVSLVGAGPGDPELLTLQAVRAIRRATVLLVDDLVGAGVLRYARRSARIVHVGKRGSACVPRPAQAPAGVHGAPPALGRLAGRPSTPQAFIHRLMVMEARRGETVVRLKGGDPFVFGRGGEEAEHLRAAGIAVQVINGISAGLAAATALGVPWTHRDHAHGVMLLTGHAGESNADLHWPTLAAAAAQGLTLVVYMGVQQLAAIQAGLQSVLGAGTPAALVQHVSTTSQRQLVTTLGCLANHAAQAGIGSPAILIVGNVLKGLQQLQGTQGMAGNAGGPRLHSPATLGRQAERVMADAG